MASGSQTQSWEVYLRWPIHALSAIESSQMINPRCLSPAVKEFIFSVALDAETNGCTPVIQDWIWSRSRLAFSGIYVIHSGCFVGEVVNQLPSDKCGDCVWWYEGPQLCEGCPNNPESEAMKMPCSQCKKILSVSDFCEIHYEEDGLHLLCSKLCKNEWEGLRNTKEEWGNHQ